MKEYVFRCNEVTKTYGKQKILNSISMNIEKGDIYGLIGQNGAGKTTIIRAISGLLIPDFGEIELFGETGKINRHRERISSFVEVPNLYPDMTAQENLELVRIQRGIPGKKCINEVLTLVGLRGVSNKKAKDFSLGMRQKLAIATTLLNAPEFLILDEPINGLDPMSIKEIRELILRINKEKGTTILISSHILSELRYMVNKYAFIDKGKVIQEIDAEELYKVCRNYLYLKVRDIGKAAIILERELNINEYKIISDESMRIYNEVEAERISLTLAKHDMGIKECMLINESVEDYFIGLIKKENVYV